MYECAQYKCCSATIQHLGGISKESTILGTYLDQIQLVNWSFEAVHYMQAWDENQFLKLFKYLCTQVFKQFEYFELELLETRPNRNQTK